MSSDWLMDIWAVSYLGMMLLIVLWRSLPHDKIRVAPTILVGVGFYVILQWSNLIKTLY